MGSKSVSSGSRQKGSWQSKAGNVSTYILHVFGFEEEQRNVIKNGVLRAKFPLIECLGTAFWYRERNPFCAFDHFT